jgi:hypothetical protein
MAIAVWPTSLPFSPLISSYSDQQGDGRTITRTTTGVGKRRAFWIGLKTLSISYNMTGTQYNTLVSFYESTLRQGVDPFFWNGNPSLGGYLYADDGTILTTDAGGPLLSDRDQLVQFATQQPIRRSQAMTEGLFRVDISLEVLP